MNTLNDNITNEKAGLINQLAGIIEKNTAKPMDVLCLMHFMLDSFELLSEVRGSIRNNYMRTSLTIKAMLLEKGYKITDEDFENMATTANSVVILAGSQAEAINLIDEMSEEMRAVIDKYYLNN